MERDSDFRQYFKMANISTHTLTWSVTGFIFGEPVQYVISTHTLTWSVTDRSYVSHFSDWISTHTLTWSVTHGTGLQARRADNFNSHAHVERDLTHTTVLYLSMNFNSHAHVERDLQRFRMFQS